MGRLVKALCLIRFDEPPVNTGAGPQLPTYLCEVLDPCVIGSVLYTSANYSHAPKTLEKIFIRGQYIPRSCVYGLELRTADKVQDSLVKVLIGNTDSSAVKSDCATYSRYRAMMCSDAWWLSGIYNGGYASVESIQAYMDRAFKSLNDQLRMLGTDWDGNPTNVSGVEYSAEVCVQFRAAWLIFPLCLIVGTLTLLVAMVVSGFASGREEIIWKSSVIPHLFYGVEDQYTHESSELPRATELERAAKNMRADFGVAERGWRFNVVNSKD